MWWENCVHGLTQVKPRPFTIRITKNPICFHPPKTPMLNKLKLCLHTLCNPKPLPCAKSSNMSLFLWMVMWIIFHKICLRLASHVDKKYKQRNWKCWTRDRFGGLALILNQLPIGMATAYKQIPFGMSIFE